jgi:transposase
MASKRTYPREFKLEAVALAKSSGKSISVIERELGITPGLLAKWKARLKVDGEQAFPGKGRLKEDDELIRRLQRENELLRQEREVLKKALAIFSKGQA